MKPQSFPKVDKIYKPELSLQSGEKLSFPWVVPEQRNAPMGTSGSIF